VDRSNDEARQQLQRVETAKEKVSRSTPVPAAGPAAEVPREIALVEATPPKPSVPPATVAETRTEPVEIAPLDLTDDLKKGAAGAPPDGLVLEPEPPVATGEPSPLPGLETAEFEPPKSSPGPLGIEIETESDVVLNSSGASEFSVPDASQDFAALVAKLNASRPRSPGRRASDRAAAASRESMAEAEPAAPAPPPAKAEPAAPAPPPAAPQPPIPARAYSARVTTGQSIAAFFQALLIARPPADSIAAPSAHGGAAHSDGETHTSNSGPRGETTSPPASSAGPGKDDLVSFDDFFGSATGGSSVAPGGGEPGKDDLDQFHSWLQNLKR
jgi:hypothetical protein